MDVRPFAVFLLAGCLGIAACHKTAHTPPAVYGEWKWVKLDWAIILDKGTTYPAADTTILLNIRQNGDFQLSINGQKRLDSTFTILPGDRILFNKQWFAFSLTTFNLGQDYNYTFNEDTLVLGYNDPSQGPELLTDTLKFIPYR